MADPNAVDPYTGKTLGEKLRHYVMNDSIPAKMVQSAWSGVTLPGDVYAGRVDPLSDEAVARSAELAGTMGGGLMSRAAPRVSSASKAVPGYNPPVKPPRPFEADYPNGAPADAAGRLTHDIEGRPLGARHVVGRNVVGEPSQPLGPVGLVATGEGLTREGIGRVASGDLRGGAGLAQFDKYSGAPLRIDISDKLSPEQSVRVLGHEVGHVIDEVAGQIPVTGLNSELRHVYNTLNTGRERQTGLMGPQHAGYKGDEVPRELMAEALRAYMADPNYLKTVAPETAARIRAHVNSNPALNKMIQFNASGVPLGLMSFGEAPNFGEGR
ncbi:hypothetical protein ACLBXM_18850 [Xanthobacteraceae bacterium A53D]